MLILIITMLLMPTKNNMNTQSVRSLDDAVLGKIQPQALPLEENVLLSCLQSNSSVRFATDMLEPTDFYKPGHVLIFEAIKTLYDTNRPVDLLSVQEQLKSAGKLDDAGGIVALLFDNRDPIFSSVEYHCTIIKDKSEKRAIIARTHQIIGDCYNDDRPAHELISDVDAAMLEIKGKALHQDKSPDEIALVSIKEMTSPTTGDILGIPMFGLHELDYTMNGAEPGDLIMIAARPSMGKSMLANTAATHCSYVLRKKTLFWGLEMTSSKNFKMHMANAANLDYEKINRGLIDVNNRAMGQVYEDYIQNKNLLNIDRTGVNISQIRSKLIHYKNTVGLDIVIIDHGRLIRKNMLNGYNEISEIEIISGLLKETAKELGIPIVLLWQLNRDVERRGGSRKPMMSDMRAAGQLEEDADKILLLHRNAYYNTNDTGIQTSPWDHATVDIAKNRSGITKELDLKFQPKHARFENWTGPTPDWSDSSGIDTPF